MNQTLEELRSRALKLTPNEELEMYAPVTQYMTLLESAIKQQMTVKPARNGFMLSFNQVPVYIMPSTIDHAQMMEGPSDLAGVTAQ